MKKIKFDDLWFKAKYRCDSMFMCLIRTNKNNYLGVKEDSALQVIFVVRDCDALQCVVENKHAILVLFNEVPPVSSVQQKCDIPHNLHWEDCN